MDLDDLRLVIAVARLGSFSAAATAMRMSQPAVSQRVSNIERAVGATLFVRDSRGARLTASGDRYLGYAARSLQLLDDGARAAAAEPIQDSLTIGIPASYAPALAPLVILAAPQAPVIVRTGHSRELMTDVIDGRLDLAIVTTGTIPSGLVSVHLLDTPVVALAAPGAKDLQRYAVHSWSDGLESILTELLGRGIERSCISVVSPAGTAVAMAVDGQAVAIVPRLCATAELNRGTLVAHNIGPIPSLRARLSWIRNTTADPGTLDGLKEAVGPLLPRAAQHSRRR